VKTQVFELLVPRTSPQGELYKLDFHRAWDQEVSRLAGGVTILEPVKGVWAAGEGYIHEGMIPVRVACTRLTLNAVLAFTSGHYDQQQVMAVLVYDEVIFFNRGGRLSVSGVPHSLDNRA
jgi:hypothetical protein